VLREFFVRELAEPAKRFGADARVRASPLIFAVPRKAFGIGGRAVGKLDRGRDRLKD
jgi:hypothetical protein